MNEVAENATGTEADMLAERQGMADVLKYALIVVSTAPILCIYPFVQKYFVQGVLPEGVIRRASSHTKTSRN